MYSIIVHALLIMQTFKEAIILFCSMIIIVHESLVAIVRIMCFFVSLYTSYLLACIYI